MIQPPTPTFIVLLFVLLAREGWGQGARTDLPDRLKQATGLSPKDRWLTPFQLDNEDLGRLEAVQKYEVPDTFTLATSQSYFHTDNVYLTRNGRRSSSAWAGLFDLSYVPYSTYRWTPRLGVEQFVFRFWNEPRANFDGQTAFVSSHLDLTRDQAWSWDIACSLSRYEGNQYKTYPYRQVEVGTGLNWQHPLSRNHAVSVFGTYEINGRLTAPKALTRIENALSFGLIYRPLDQVSIQPYVQTALHYYPADTALQRNRHDFNLIAGLALTWTPTKNFSLGGGFNWTGNYSSLRYFDYDVALPAIGLFGSIGF